MMNYNIVEMEDMNIFKNDDDNEDIVDVESSIIDSKLIGRQLFHTNLAPVTDEQQVVCWGVLLTFPVDSGTKSTKPQNCWVWFMVK